MKQKKVWIMCGVPGSGKSSYVRNVLAHKGGVHCSRDEVRFSILQDGEDYFAYENEVFATWIKNINEAIKNPEVYDIYVDATHLNDRSRRKTLKYLTKEVEYDICFVILDVPLKICLERNKKRTGREYVPPATIESMYASFEASTSLGPQLVISWEEEE